MKQTNDLAYLRQICNLGLEKEIVIPEFLKAIQAVIPSDNNFFTGTNENGLPNYYLTERFLPNFVDIAAEVLPRFFTPEKSSYVYQNLNNYPVITDHNLLDERFFQSDLYNLLWHPWGRYHFILAPVIFNRRAAGMLFLFRPAKERPFSMAEQYLCIQLLPYISHALQANKNNGTDYVNSGQSSLLIVDSQGVIIHQSPSAKRLLALASLADCNEYVSTEKLTIPFSLVKSCRNLNALFKGEDTAQPILTHTNAAGRFIFRAYWLDQPNDNPNNLIGVTIEHQESLTLKIMRNLQNQPLSATQKVVALMLAQGYSNEKIGQSLYIKPTTVKDHIRKIFIKLDIHRREELMPKLQVKDDSKMVSNMLEIKIKKRGGMMLNF